MPETQTLNAARLDPAGFAFGRFVLRRHEHLLLADGGSVKLGSRAFGILLALVEADGALLTKDALLNRTWPDVVVAENSLQVQVSALRRVLGPERDWIATVPGRGYRFTGPVAALPDAHEAVAPAAVMARHSEVAAPPPLSVLVLPFAGRGADPAGIWFADGLTDSLVTDLARALPGSSVITQANADTYKDHPPDVRTIARAQRVRYVLEGSVLLVCERVRVNAQLVAADTGINLWADRFDTPRHSDVLQAQDVIVGRLARSVGLQMIAAEARRAERAEHKQPDEEGKAQDYVLRARAAADQPRMTRDSIEAACALYSRALEWDSGNADALAGLACSRTRSRPPRWCSRTTPLS